MLQRTRAKQVQPVYEEFRERFPSPEAFLQATPEERQQVFERLGLAWRSERLEKAAHYLHEHEPAYNVDELKEVPGVGHYAAAAVASFYGDTRAALIDNNIARFAARICGQDYGPETRRASWLKSFVDAMTPSEDVRTFNYGLLDVSRTICVRTPLCDRCPVSMVCCYRRSRG